MKSIAILLFVATSLLLVSTDLPAQQKGRGVDLTGTPERPNRTLFSMISPEASSIRFANTIVETDSFNLVDYIYAYNGSGVATGDVNGDGLADIYFVGTQAPSRLYINRGGFRFEDMSKKAGVDDASGIRNGVTMVDIDSDGDLDIYVSKQDRPNALFINNGRGIFKENARAFGLDYNGSSTQAAFFDYDGDGDLDLYQLVNGRAREKDYVKRGMNDRLMRNDNGKFRDVTKEAGISDVGYGLNVSIGDLNNDTRPDIYVTNDFDARDILYINNGDGTFSNRTMTMLRHTTEFGMGSDVADFNNDGLLDIVTADMLPRDHLRKQQQLGSMSTYSPQFDSAQLLRNTLQLNRGDGTFSDIAQLAGVDQTDWSWATLLADFDNDGMKDLFVATGTKRDINDQDYLYYVDKNQPKLQLVTKMPSTRVRNYFFHNNGDLTFGDVGRDEGIGQEVNTNGAAYADFDNDGDLDLVISNVDTVAFLYRNNAVEQKRGNYLKVKLDGGKGNRLGVGSSVTIMSRGVRQVVELNPTRGFLSSVEPTIHFGIGDQTVVEWLSVQWPDGSLSNLENVPGNQTITVKKGSEEANTISVGSDPLFRAVDTSRTIAYSHVENNFDDFKRERMLPSRLSQYGPGIAVGDVDGNGLDDIYIGGAKGSTGGLFLQQQGHFSQSASDPFEADIRSEDQSALFLDIDGDNDRDLYVVSGGNDFPIGDTALQDRVYINDGRGNFSRSSSALPRETSNGSTAVAADYDGDGDLDIFVGGRGEPGSYPAPSRSFLLNNTGGTFTDVTDRDAPGLSTLGMISSALWSDFDNDNDPDLIVTGEWMSVRFLRNDAGRFTDITAASGIEQMTGWWNSLNGGDFDNDGDIDYVAGNLGYNARYRTSPTEPVGLYVSDFDGNGATDLVMSYYNDGVEYPARNKQATVGQMPTISRRFPTFRSYGEATLEKLYTRAKLDAARKFKATTFASSYIENLGGGRFAMRALPIAAQFSPTFGTVVEDFDGDGELDLLLAGNFFGPDPEVVRYDAGNGLLLKGDGKGGFMADPTKPTGFEAPGNVRGLAPIQMGGNLVVAVIRNSGRPELFETRLDLSGSNLYRPKTGQRLTHAVMTMKDGRTRRYEFHTGSGYLTQGSTAIVVSKGARSLDLYNGAAKVESVTF